MHAALNQIDARCHDSKHDDDRGDPAAIRCSFDISIHDAARSAR
jgi:hypothetical protein